MSYSLTIPDVMLVMAYCLERTPKELRKKLIRLRTKAPRSCQVMLQEALKQKDPKQYIRQCIEDVTSVPVIVQTLVNAGHHGMVVIDDAVYPITIDPETYEDGQWCLTEEEQLALGIASAVRDVTGLHGRLARLYLFRPCGFSGATRDYRL